MNPSPAEQVLPRVGGEAAASSRSRWRTAVACGLAVVVASAATTLVSDYWRGNFKLPLRYEHDTLLYLPLVKGLHENGTVWTNPRLGAPDGFVLYDFPIPDSLHFLSLRALCGLTGDYVIGFNLFVLLQFPLAALTGTWAARQFGASVLSAVAAGVLFAYLPYHSTYHSTHIFMTAYYPVPLAFWLVVRVYLGEVRLLRRDPATGQLRPPYLSADAVAALVVCGVVASTGAYSAFFTAGLLVVASVGAALEARRMRMLMPGVLFALVVAAGLGANLLPAVLHQREHGKNESLRRYEGEANTWALHPAELFLPSPDHRLHWMAKLSGNYDTAFGSTVQTEAVKLSSLGVVSAAGVLSSLVLGLRRVLLPTDDVRPVLTRLMVVMLLVAVAGGFGPLFNHLVSPWIRCYHRSSIFLGYAGALTVALTVTRWGEADRRWVRVGAAIAPLALLAVGLYDQTFPQSRVGPQEVRRAFHADREFVRAVEESLPPGAAVFQLPYVPYPESAPVGEISYYGPGVVYLHSDRLRWSYAATKGRRTAELNADAATAPAEQLVPHLVLQGFTAVWLDRWGYPNRRPPVEGGLAALADGPPVVSPDGRYAVFAFTRYRDALTARVAAGERPVVMVSRGWTNGFFTPEFNPGGTPERWRWCGAEGIVTLNNVAEYPQRVRITFSAGSYMAGDWHLTLDGLGLHETVPIAVAMTRVERVVVVPPGTHTVRLACDATPIPIGGRTLVFRVADDTIQTLPDGAN